MNLRDLRYLVALADHRHFGRAAEASFVSQPTLSTQIRKLEEELGVELFERTPRHVMLTEVGSRIVERARVVLRESDHIRDIARRTQDPESGSLRIGLFPTLGPYLLPHVVPRVRERFPRMEMLLFEEKTEDVLHGLRDGHLDVGLLALPVHDDQLHEEFLFEEPFVLAVPSEHPLAGHRGPVSSNVIEGQSLLLLQEGHCLRDQALEVCRLAGAAERTGFRATSLETLRQMVAAGVGITLLPMLAVRPPVAEPESVELIAFTDPPPSRKIAMFWRKTSAYRDFLPGLAGVFRDLPPGILANRLDRASALTRSACPPPATDPLRRR
jgi:LysR family hydrogen peroxide-inducible transcriptional activator